MSIFSKKKIGIDQAFRKKEKLLYEMKMTAGCESGLDVSQVLMFQALHDMYGFGRNRFERMAKKWIDVEKNGNDYVLHWFEKLKQEGFSSTRMDKYCETLERLITGNEKDIRIKERVRNMLAGGIVVMMITLYEDYGFRRRRIEAIQRKLNDYAYLIKKGDVSIWQFMECLHRECGITIPTLEEYRNDPDPRRRQEHAEELMIYGPLDQKRVKYDEHGKQVAS